MKITVYSILIGLIFACSSQENIQLPPPETVSTKPKTESIDSIQKKERIFSIMPYDYEELRFEKKIISSEIIKEKKSKKISKNGFRIQVMVISDFQKAKDISKQLIHELKELPFQVYFDFYSPSYRIRVGDFENKEDAKKIIPELEKLGYKDAFIVPDKINLYVEE